MNQDQWTAVDRYITDKAGGPGCGAGSGREGECGGGIARHRRAPNQGKLLHVLALTKGRAADSGDWHAGRIQHHLAGAGAARRRAPGDAGG